MKNIIKMSCAGLLTMIGLNSVQAVQGFEMPPAQVQVIEASMRMMAPQIVVSGSVISVNDSRLSAEVEGPMVWIADVGTKVNKGDVVARIDDRNLKIALRSAKANLKRLAADLAFQESDLQRYQKLAEKNNTSKARLDATLSRRDMRKHEVANAEAMVDKAEGDLERAALKAPYAGHIAQRLANVGEYITIGKEMVRLVDTQNLEVVMPAPLRIISYLKPGLEVEVRDGVRVELLPIRTVVPVGHQVSRMVEVRLSIPSGLWVVGTPVQISLPKGLKQDMVTVSRDAIVLKGTSAMLYKVSEDNSKAEQLRFDFKDLIAVGPWVAIESGLKVGDKVIIRGAERLSDGQSIAVAN